MYVKRAFHPQVKRLTYTFVNSVHNMHCVLAMQLQNVLNYELLHDNLNINMLYILVRLFNNELYSLWKQKDYKFVAYIEGLFRKRWFRECNSARIKCVRCGMHCFFKHVYV